MHSNAVKLDKKYGNTKWQDTVETGIEKHQEHETCKDLGKDGKLPEG